MYTKLRIFFIIVLLFTFSKNDISLANTERNIQVDNIIVKNNQRIDTETILSYLNLNPGDKVNYEILK